MNKRTTLLAFFPLVAVCVVAAVLGGCRGPEPRIRTTLSIDPAGLVEIGSAGTPAGRRPYGLLRATGGVPAAYYRVSKTDSLASVAVKFYGDRDRSYEIHAANKALIDERSGLKRGMVIALPEIEGRPLTNPYNSRP